MINKDIKFFRVNGDNVEIEHAKFKMYIHSLGIWRYQLDQKNFIFVQIQDSIIREITIPEIKNMVLDHLSFTLTRDKEVVIEKIHKMIHMLFGQHLLETLPATNIESLQDPHNLSYLFFKNCFVTITAEQIDIKSFDFLPQSIWYSRIINRVLMDLEKVATMGPSEFELFCNLICGNNDKKILSLKSILGYLLHGYKDPSNPRAVIISEKQSEEHSLIPNGRTGKGLLINAIMRFKKVTKEDGKFFNPKSNFVFQQIDVDTELLWFDDVKPDFDLLKLFSVISEGIQVEKKFQNKFTIPYWRSPKIVITSNYPLKGIGESYEGRRIEFFLERYFNAKHSPKDEFGHLFFINWDAIEWAKFDAFMINCIKTYLKHGIIEYIEPELMQNKLATITSPDFSKFCYEKIELDRRYEIKQLYQDFNSYSGVKVAPISQNMFSRFIEKFTEIEGLIYDEKQSNGKKYITLYKK